MVTVEWSRGWIIGCRTSRTGDQLAMEDKGAEDAPSFFLGCLHGSDVISLCRDYERKRTLELGWAI